LRIDKEEEEEESVTRWLIFEGGWVGVTWIETKFHLPISVRERERERERERIKKHM
jgi:hypothetical protein